MRLAGGVGGVRRVEKGRSDGNPGTVNELFAAARAHSKSRESGGAPKWTPSAGFADLYISMGQTAENVVQAEGVTREGMDD